MTLDPRHAILDMQPSTCDPRRATLDLRPSTSDSRLLTLDLLPSTITQTHAVTPKVTYERLINVLPVILRFGSFIVFLKLKASAKANKRCLILLFSCGLFLSASFTHYGTQNVTLVYLRNRISCAIYVQSSKIV